MPEVIEAPAPESEVEVSANEQFADAFADLDKYAESKASAPAPDKPDTDKPSEDKPKSQETTKAEAKEAPESKPTKSKSADKSEKPEKPEKPLPIPEIRKAYDKLKAEHAALKAQLEKAPKAPPKDESAETEWKTKLTDYEKQLEAERERARKLDAIVKQTAYENDPDYQAQYVQPIHDEINMGRLAVAGMDYVDPEGNTRKAVAEDFDEVIGTTNPDKARQIAKARFPGDVSEVMSLWKDVMKQVARKNAALAKWNKEYSQREQQKMESEKAISESRNKIWQAGHSTLREKHPDLFKPIEGDDEGNSILEAGIRRAEAIFCGGKLTDDKGNEYQPTDEDMVRLHLESYLKTAGFNRLVRDKRALKAEVEKLKTQLSEYQKSSPGAGDGGAAKAESDEDDIDAALAKFARPAY